MLDPSILEELAHDRYQLDELREDEHFVTHTQYLGQDSVKQFKFTSRHKDPVRVVTGVTLQELIRMIRDLSQLHHRVSQTLIADFASSRISCQSSFKNAIVNNLLPVG